MIWIAPSDKDTAATLENRLWDADDHFRADSRLKSQEYSALVCRHTSGLPRTDNANYLWIQLFHSALNEKGRAEFAMANSASDARLATTP